MLYELPKGKPIFSWSNHFRSLFWLLNFWTPFFCIGIYSPIPWRFIRMFPISITTWSRIQFSVKANNHCKLLLYHVLSHCSRWNIKKNPSLKICFHSAMWGWIPSDVTTWGHLFSPDYWINPLPLILNTFQKPWFSMGFIHMWDHRIGVFYITGME